MPPRSPEPYYPSFALAGIALMTGDSSLFSRLPAYRESQLRRFHPYARVERSRLPSTADTVDEPNFAENGDTAAHTGHVEGADSDEEIRANLERAMYGEERMQRRAFLDLIIVLALVVRRGDNSITHK
ncbi:hypothetical protein OH76DRAFT_1479106 [Lentinus brumalis]|uniref:Uncharacterized protein n=1 Tax=Lentinus brumalis TaxID=2498619 RepID=A0A371DND4_9APHY|nr:hypothetical protein OH76DRAFT_1479106 [Polyporus brumalis]